MFGDDGGRKFNQGAFGHRFLIYLPRGSVNSDSPGCFHKIRGFRFFVMIPFPNVIDVI